MSGEFSGHYPIERRAGEIERLHTQSAAMAPDTRTMLDLIGVKEGWSCLDIGCGPGGITGLLSERVGRSGRVVGLDRDAEFLAHARSARGRQYRIPAGRCLRLGLAGRQLRSRAHAVCREHCRRPRTPVARGDPAGAAGRHGRAAGARRDDAELLSGASGVGQIEGGAARGVQRRRRGPHAGAAALFGGAAIRACRTCSTGRSCSACGRPIRWWTICRRRWNRCAPPWCGSDC